MSLECIISSGFTTPGSSIVGRAKPCLLSAPHPTRDDAQNVPVLDGECVAGLRGNAHGSRKGSNRIPVWVTGEDHIAKLRDLQAHDVKQFNMYLMSGAREDHFRAYGEHIIPLLAD